MPYNGSKFSFLESVEGGVSFKEKPLYMAIDQWGQIEHGLVHPRKDLMERLYRKHAGKMYFTTKDGDKHVGYIIAKRWLQVFEVRPMKRPA